MNIKVFPWAVVTVLFAIFIVTLWQDSRVAEGSALMGNDYQSTTTVSIISGTFGGVQLLKTGQGSLAQVTVTGANTGNIVFYDATTTNVNLRTGQKATSTITLADISASVAAGTYTFDTEFNTGLLMVRIAGVGPTSTVMWR